MPQFRVTYHFAIGPQHRGLATDTKEADGDDQLAQEYLLAVAQNAIIPVRLAKGSPEQGIAPGALLLFPARGIYQMFVEELSDRRSGS